MSKKVQETMKVEITMAVDDIEFLENLMVCCNDVNEDMGMERCYSIPGIIHCLVQYEMKHPDHFVVVMRDVFRGKKS